MKIVSAQVMLNPLAASEATFLSEWLVTRSDRHRSRELTLIEFVMRATVCGSLPAIARAASHLGRARQGRLGMAAIFIEAMRLRIRFPVNSPCIVARRRQTFKAHFR